MVQGPQATELAGSVAYGLPQHTEGISESTFAISTWYKECEPEFPYKVCSLVHKYVATTKIISKARCFLKVSGHEG